MEGVLGGDGGGAVSLVCTPAADGWSMCLWVLVHMGSECILYYIIYWGLAVAKERGGCRRRTVGGCFRV